MGDSKLVQIDVFFDLLAAQQAMNWLDHEGIPAFVEGANTNSAFNIGSALAGVKLLVAKQDQERARSALQQYHSERPDGTTWYCGECEEFNEPSFDLCWCCGKNREVAEQPAPIKTTQRQSEIIEDELHSADIPRVIESGNPYQPPYAILPLSHNRETQLEHEQIEQTEVTEANIQRAWRASIFGLGLVFPTPILHIYSVILLLCVNRQVPISVKYQRQFKLAWSVNIIVILSICIAISVIAIRYL